VPAFANTLSKIKEKLDLYNYYANKSFDSTKSKTLAKKISRTALENQLIYLFRGAVVFARDRKNYNLEGEMNVNPSDVRKWREVTLVSYSNATYKLLLEHINELADYGIDMDSLTEL